MPYQAVVTFVLIQGAALEPGALAQRPISEEDVCPICQEELLSKHLPVTYCK